MTKVANIAKNTSYLTIALILQKVVSFAYFAFLARNLGPESLGKYYFAISVTSIFAIFIDLGFINFLTREIAKRQNEAGSLLGNILSLKIPLSFLTVFAVIIFVNLFSYDGLTKTLVYVSMICMVLDSFTTTFFAVARGFHNLKYESISSVIFQLIVLVFGLGAMYFDLGLPIIMATLALASIYNFIYSFAVISKKLRIKIKLLYNSALTKTIFKISLPFAWFAIFQRIYTYLDSVLLSVMAGDYYVGLYQVAFKIIFALQFLPMAFIASLYPAMSLYWLSNRGQLKIALERALNYLTIISLPIIFGTIVLSDQIILIFKSGYSEAVLPLQITIVALFFIFVNFPIGSLLNACDRQKQNTRNMLVVVIFSVVLNLILIPRFKTIGASVTVLLSNALMFVLGMFWVKKILPDYKLKNNILIFFKSLAAALIMALLVLFLKDYLNIFVAAILAGILYFSLIFAFGCFHKADIAYIINSFKKGKPTSSDSNDLSSEINL